MSRILFITGTDTGVGKTVVTALLLAHAQAVGIKVRALKPFSSGSQEDAALIGSLQERSLRINFFHYSEPISPWSAARIRGQSVTIQQALEPIREHGANCELLLVEGAGGVLTPLGERFSAADLIRELGADAILVAANWLGVLNHTLLSAEVLRNGCAGKLKIALVEPAAKENDISARTNLADLKQLLSESVTSIPVLAGSVSDAEGIRAAAKKLRGELNALLD